MESGEIDKMVNSLQTCATSLSLSTRQEVAEVAMNMVYQFSYSGDDAGMAKLVAVPGLLHSLASLCGEETLLDISPNLVVHISSSAFYLSIRSPAGASALVEAGWTDLLIMSLRARPHDVNALGITSWAIYRLLFENPAVCSASFINAGAEAALEEAVNRHPNNSYITEYCMNALGILKDDRE
jgi:hypothetical protein